jgi:hypothetical protein
MKEDDIDDLHFVELIESILVKRRQARAAGNEELARQYEDELKTKHRVRITDLPTGCRWEGIDT